MPNDDEKYALSRRTFLKIAGATAAGYAVLRGIPGIEAATQVVDEAATSPLPPGTAQWVYTMCQQCDAGCGLRVKVLQGKAIKIEGNPLFPTNQGGVCPKGQAALQVLYDPDRIRTPLRRVGQRGEGKWETVTWPQAMDEVVQKLKTLRDQGQAHTVAFMNGRRRDHLGDLIGRFMEAYGSPNNLSSAGPGSDLTSGAYYLAQGTWQPVAFDMANSNYVIFFGAAWAESWGPSAELARLHGFIRQDRPGIRTKLVQVDHRLSMSAAKCDEQVYVRPGTDGALALGMANIIVNEKLYNQEFVTSQAFGFEDWQDSAGGRHTGFKTVVTRDYLPAAVSKITGVAEGDIYRLAREFAYYQPSLALSGDGASAQTNGIYSQWAVHSLNALMGSFGKAGGIVERRSPGFTAWPDVVRDSAARSGLSQARIDGAGGSDYPFATGVGQGLTRSLQNGSPYGINALFLYDVNPAYDELGAKAFTEALGKVPFIVSFSPFQDDTTLYADLVLPDCTFLEKWDEKVVISTAGYPVVGLAQPVMEPLYDSASTGDAIVVMAHMLGGSVGDSFPWKGQRGAIQDAMKGIAQKGKGSPRAGNFPEFWQKAVAQGGWWDDAPPAAARFTFGTPSKKFEFYSQTMKDKIETLAKVEAGTGSTSDKANILLQRLKVKAQGDQAYLPHYEEPRLSGDEKQYPYYLNTYKPLASGGDANAPFLSESFVPHLYGSWDSWIEINPETAHELGISEGAEVWVESPVGKLKAKAKLYPGAMPGVVNMPLGFGHKGWGRWANNIGINPGAIVATDTDYLAGVPAWGATRVRISRAD